MKEKSIGDLSQPNKIVMKGIHNLEFQEIMKNKNKEI